MVTYLLVLISWGIWQGRKVKTSGDYAIAGRRLPGWVAALSERATGESSWALLGLPGAAYALGLTEIWTALGCVTGIITAWWLLAWRLRDAADKSGSITFSEFVAGRFQSMGPYIRLVSAAAIVFSFSFMWAHSFSAGARPCLPCLVSKPAGECSLPPQSLFLTPYTAALEALFIPM
ncbi:MAG: hypothetical protein LWX09_00550 [Bacteroidia bacterium]|nr:hypothetical protein [Bacteroidia bacterium]